MSGRAELVDMVVADYKPADYNPRKITPEAFAKLRESIRRFGMVKPVIVNRNGILVAGHQRTKALQAEGVATTPAIRLPVDARLTDEIGMNLAHNSIETSLTPVRIRGDVPVGEYTFVAPERVKVDAQPSKGRGPVLAMIGTLIRRYGAWGSVVIDGDGKVLVNSEYADVAARLGFDVLAYRLPDEDVEGFLEFMKLDYGVYSYEGLQVAPWAQTHCQPKRTKSKADGDDVARPSSTMYENVILPTLAKSDRLFDFGAGRGAMHRWLVSKGFDSTVYEPFLRDPDADRFDFVGLVESLRDLYVKLGDGGLFDIVSCDAVLNSVTSPEWSERVLASLWSLCADDGVVHISTRSLEFAQTAASTSHQGFRGNRLLWLDEDGFMVNYVKGAWTMQRFLSPDEFVEMASRWFGSVELHKTYHPYMHIVSCREPLPQAAGSVESALGHELNMVYPNGYQHNKAAPVVARILELNQARLTEGLAA